MEKFRQTQRELSQEIEKSTGSLSKQIEKLRKQAETMKKDKTTIAGRISEAIASGQNPENLYVEIYKVSSEVHNLEDTVRVLEREKQYPSTPQIQKLGAALFNDFVELISKHIQFSRGLEALNEKFSFIYDILNVYTGQLQNLQTSFSSAERFGIQSYCFFNREGSTNLFREPNKEPGPLETETLYEHGITLEDFKKNRKKFAEAYRLAENGEIKGWSLRYGGIDAEETDKEQAQR